MEIVDEFALERETARVEYSLMTPCRPDIAEPGVIQLEYAPGRLLRIRYDAEALTAEAEEVPLTDERLRKNWGERVYRLLLTERSTVQSGTRTLRISLDGGA